MASVFLLEQWRPFSDSPDIIAAFKSEQSAMIEMERFQNDRYLSGIGQWEYHIKEVEFRSGGNNGD